MSGLDALKHRSHDEEGPIVRMRRISTLRRIVNDLVCTLFNGKESKRSSDYTSTTHAELTMKRQPLSEGVQLIVDATNKTVRKGLQMNDSLINGQVEKAAKAAGIDPSIPAGGDDSGGDTPAPAPSGGGKG